MGRAYARKGVASRKEGVASQGRVYARAGEAAPRWLLPPLPGRPPPATCKQTTEREGGVEL